MDFTSSADILAQASRFGEELKQLEGLLDGPRADLRRHIAALYDGFADLLVQVSTGLQTRDSLLARIDEASEEMRRLAAQVKVMDAEVRTLQARVEQRDGHADPFAGRH